MGLYSYRLSNKYQSDQIHIRGSNPSFIHFSFNISERKKNIVILLDEIRLDTIHKVFIDTPWHLFSRKTIPVPPWHFFFPQPLSWTVLSDSPNDTIIGKGHPPDSWPVPFYSIATVIDNILSIRCVGDEADASGAILVRYNNILVLISDSISSDTSTFFSSYLKELIDILVLSNGSCHDISVARELFRPLYLLCMPSVECTFDSTLILKNVLYPTTSNFSYIFGHSINGKVTLLKQNTSVSECSAQR